MPLEVILKLNWMSILISSVKFMTVEEIGAEVKAVCRSGNFSNERMRTSGED